ncbi:MAG: LLM class F420-dependent oxidoreductase [Dehalococcoidia bacterium]|nr:LLM class F420-dependent oxidoreductase [Dehalococcoidia bacterium]
MHFGVSIPHYGQPFSVDALRETVQRAEALGFGSAWVGDHVITPQHFVDAVGPNFYDAIIVLSHAAAFTTRLRLGTSVIVVPYRSPLVVAKMVATLDALSGGRVIFGVGAGNAPDEFQALGVPPSTRGRRTNEYLEAMVTLWTQEPTTFHGKFVDFQDVHFQPKPVQQPHPPIWVGGHSQAALRRAVAFGEAWHSGGMAPERMTTTVQELRRLALEAGRANGPAVTTRISIRITDATNPHGQAHRPGAGTVQQVRADLARYQEIGVSAMVCDFGLAMGPELFTAMERFAQKVAPHFPDR